ncbi:MAG: redoxin domain-containing protein [Oceanospirillaceae bacterium]
MNDQKLLPGMQFPSISLNTLDAQSIDLAAKKEGCDWKLVVVYRGKHCPLCVKYLNTLEQHREALLELKVDVAAVSADREEQLSEFNEKLTVNFPIHYGLSLQQMQQLGLFISSPRSEQENDHLYPEPAIFVVNEQGLLHLVSTSNNPFIRPEISELVAGISWLKNPENNYPIRGGYSE